MGPNSSLALLLGAGFVSAVVLCVRKGRRTQAVISVFFMFAALIWMGLLILGIGLGYAETEDGEDPVTPGSWESVGLITLGGAPLLVAFAIPVIGATKAPLPDSKMDRQRIPPPHPNPDVARTQIPPPKAPEAGNPRL